MRVAANSARVPNLSFREALKFLVQPEDNVHFSSATPEWYTPAEIIQRVDAALGGIELDPCSDPQRPRSLKRAKKEGF
jgi:hypothetical protein